MKDLDNYGNREESTFVRKKPSKHELKSLSLIADKLVVSDPLTEPTQTLWGINCSVYSVATAWKVCKATITWCDLSSRFFCIDATLLCEFESDKI